MAKLAITVLFARMMGVGWACDVQYPECQNHQSRQKHGPEKSSSHAENSSSQVTSLGIIERKYINGH